MISYTVCVLLLCRSVEAIRQGLRNNEVSYVPSDITANNSSSMSLPEGALYQTVSYICNL